MNAIEELLKATNSLTAELVPGSAFDKEMKDFVWKLYEINQRDFNLRFIFENPEYISMD